MNVFPFTLDADILTGFSAGQYLDDFLRVKPRGLVWYGYDVTVCSRTKVTFTVYDMLDNFRGGLGKQIATFESAVSEETTRDSVERRILALAKQRRLQEIEANEQAIVKAYADKIRKELA